jgi:hypothetical protein
LGYTIVILFKPKKEISVNMLLPRFCAIRRSGAVLVGALLMTWPALYNRYPLLYPDSMSYLEDARLVARALFLPESSAIREQSSGIAVIRLADYASTLVRVATSQPHTFRRGGSKERSQFTWAKDYSCLNATIGSTRMARRAGMKHAAIATASSRRATLKNVSQSSGLTT